MGVVGDVADLGSRLLAAYGDASRGYHDLHHLADVLDHVDLLAEAAADANAVRLAAWFHDSVYDPHAPDNEERSAAMAEHELAALRIPSRVIDEVARLVRLTISHDPEDSDSNGAVLCDADLGVLGRSPEGYAAYAAAVRQEYAFVDDAAFRSGRSAILRALLDRPAIFRTTTGTARWEAQARRNLSEELATLASG
jgi:predicted metal-dependent HD superfamily phosphohydrolase